MAKPVKRGPGSIRILVGKRTRILGFATGVSYVQDTVKEWSIRPLETPDTEGPYYQTAHLLLGASEIQVLLDSSITAVRPVLITEAHCATQYQ
jgi:hypothetical protein